MTKTKTESFRRTKSDLLAADLAADLLDLGVLVAKVAVLVVKGVDQVAKAVGLGQRLDLAVMVVDLAAKGEAVKGVDLVVKGLGHVEEEDLEQVVPISRLFQKWAWPSSEAGRWFQP